MRIVFSNLLISEAKVAFYFARYIKLSTEGLVRIFKALLLYFPERVLDIGKRYFWVHRLALVSGMPNDAITVIEEFLISQANRHEESGFSEQSTNNLYSGNFSNLINHFAKDFVSSDLSDYALDLSEDMMNQINFMYRLSPILSTNAKNHLLGLKKIDVN